MDLLTSWSYLYLLFVLPPLLLLSLILKDRLNSAQAFPTGHNASKVE